MATFSPKSMNMSGTDRASPLTKPRRKTTVMSLVSPSAISLKWALTRTYVGSLSITVMVAAVPIRLL